MTPAGDQGALKAIIMSGSVVINDVPLRKFDANQAYGNFIGIKTRFINGHGQIPMNSALEGINATISQPPGGILLAPSVISNPTVWANWIGIVSSYTNMRHEHVLNVAGITRTPDKQDLAFQPAVGVFIRGPRVLSFSDFRIANYPKGKYVAGDKGEAVPETTFDGITTY